VEQMFEMERKCSPPLLPEERTRFRSTLISPLIWRQKQPMAADR
jgi:hypothetical protein